jgi:hypothetical protein
VYNIIYVVKEIFALYQYLLYLSNQSRYPTLSLRLLKITLTFANDNKETGLIELIKQLAQGNFSANNGLEVLKLTIIRSIELGAFFLQFLRWWNQEHYSNFNLMKLPIPPAPQVAHIFYILFSNLILNDSFSCTNIYNFRFQNLQKNLKVNVQFVKKPLGFIQHYPFLDLFIAINAFY